MVRSVVLFVGLADALEDFDGLFHRRFVHNDRLEAAFQGRIAFDMFAIFIQRGGADAPAIRRATAPV